MNRLFTVVRPLARVASRNNNTITAFPTLRTQWFSTAQSFLDRGDVADRVRTVLANFDKVEAAKVTEEAKFIEDLGLDSLDVVEVVMAMEEEFVIEIPDQESEKLLTAGQVIDYITSHPMAK